MYVGGGFSVGAEREWEFRVAFKENVKVKGKLVKAALGVHLALLLVSH